MTRGRKPELGNIDHILGKATIHSGEKHFQPNSCQKRARSTQIVSKLLERPKGWTEEQCEREKKSEKTNRCHLEPVSLKAVTDLDSTGLAENVNKI